MRRGGRAAIVVAGLGAVAVPGDGGLVRAQEKPPTFSAVVELVTVDVVVTDTQGNPVTDLQRADFALLEEGVPQAITSFEAVTGRDPPAELAPAPLNPRVSTNAGAPVRPARTLVIVFDRWHLSAEQAERGRRALGRFLRTSVFDGERVRLVVGGGREVTGTRDDLLAVLPDLPAGRVPDEGPEALSDHEAMRLLHFDDQPLLMRILHRFEILSSGHHTQFVEGERIHAVKPEERIGPAGGRFDEGYVKARARQVYDDAVRRNEATLDALEGVLGSLAAAPGRKSVILVSEGFIKDPELPGFERVVEVSRRANAALYFLDTRGLTPLPHESAQHKLYLPSAELGFAVADQAFSSAGAEGLAADTGGFTVKNRNDLGIGLMRIAADTRNYYLLGYSPTRPDGGGAFRRLQVKVRRKGTEVRARKGYYASPSSGATPGGEAPELGAVLREPRERAGIPLRMSAYVFGESRPGQVRALVATDVDVARLAFESREGRFHCTLDVLLVVSPAAGGESGRYAQAVELSLTSERRDALAKSALPIVRGFDLAPGAYRSRAAVRDRRSGRVGTVSHEFEVPAAGWRTSTPVLSDTAEPLGDPSRPVPAIAARRVFRAEGRLFFQYDVYGAQRDPATGEPSVLAGWTLRDREGATRATEEPARLVPSARGSLSRSGQIPLAMPPGDYELVFEVRDVASGRTLTVREPFTLEAPSGS